MVNRRSPTTRRGPAHVRHRNSGSPARPTARRRRWLIPVALILLVALIGVFAGLQWTRTVPRPVFRPALATSVHLPGTSPSLPWPTTGSAALTMEGVGSLGQVGSTQSVPIASITKVMTAYVVLKDHPLGPGATGPAIPVTADTLAAYETGLATQQSVVKVTAGESLTELEALEGLLIPSGNDLATLLAEWDAGTTTAFIAKMNSTAETLGLTATHFADVSGLDSGSMSTATDLLRLGEAAMGEPTFPQIVAMGQVTLPVAGLLYNFDYDIGHDGIIGIKTGTDAAAGGCFLFEAQRTVDSKKVTIVGAVLGQQTSSPITAVLSSAEALVTAAFADMTTVPVVAPDQLDGNIVAPWGDTVAVKAPQSPSIVGWPGLSVPAQLRVGRLPSVVTRGTRIGVLDVDLDGQHIDVALRASGPISGPSAIWRLTRA
jgi:serine-type D-Ala-D-Ala carboxypeptidase (penicillin-binding protein 5/6)